MTRIRYASLVVAAGATVLLSACQGPPPPIPRSPVQASMYRHFALARDLRSFAVWGWLDSLRTTAAEFAATEETWGLPPGGESSLSRIREAAGRAAGAHDMAAAAGAVAELAAECGACHLVNDVGLGSRFQIAAPLTDGSVVRHMNHLAWTSRLLWDGLVGPSDRTWQAGAEALASAESLPDPLAQHVSREELAQAGDRLRELGEQALSTEAAAERAGVLAEVWRVCADCHEGAGVR